MLAAPAVKLIIAGTRPADIRPSRVTTAPLALGSITPIGSPFGRQRHQLGAEDRGARQQALVGQRAGDRILDRDASCGRAGRAASITRLEHGAVGRGGAEHQIRHDAVERGACRLPALAALELGIDRELHRLEDRDLDLREPLAAHLALGQPGERRLLEALDAHRHDLGVGLVGDHGGAVIDLHQAAGDGDAALREDDQRLAGLDRVDQRARRHRLHRVERHRVGQLQERLHPPALARCRGRWRTPACGRAATAPAPASRKLTWLSAMMTLGPALVRFSRPFTSMRNSAR